VQTVGVCGAGAAGFVLMLCDSKVSNRNSSVCMSEVYLRMREQLQAIVTVLSLVNPMVCGGMFARIEANHSPVERRADGRSGASRAWSQQLGCRSARPHSKNTPKLLTLHPGSDGRFFGMGHVPSRRTPDLRAGGRFKSAAYLWAAECGRPSMGPWAPIAHSRYKSGAQRLEPGKLPVVSDQ
jgi:hypothetical protein